MSGNTAPIQKAYREQSVQISQGDQLVLEYKRPTVITLFRSCKVVKLNALDYMNKNLCSVKFIYYKDKTECSDRGTATNIS